MYTYTYVFMYVCTGMYVCTYVCMCVGVYVCMYVCMHACVYVCMYACMYVCMYVCYVCLYVCVCMYVCSLPCMYVLYNITHPTPIPPTINTRERTPDRRSLMYITEYLYPRSCTPPIPWPTLANWIASVRRCPIWNVPPRFGTPRSKLYI